MTEEKKDSKKCGGKKKIMFAYGIIQLGSSFVSAIALVAIAFGFFLGSISEFFRQQKRNFKNRGFLNITPIKN